MIRNSILLLLSLSALAPGQGPADEEVRTRQLWDTTLLAKRPSGKKPAATKALPNRVDGALVGITVWRLRPSRPGDAREVRALIHVETGNAEFTPERIAADRPLSEGQKVRISIEAAQEGYLYIIDRDEYADGTKSDPYLIFPTLAIHKGQNHVAPGVVVQIPAEDEGYFNVERSKPNQISEVLTFLITPRPLAEIKIGQRQKLGEEQVVHWQNQWKAKSYKLEDAAHEGKVYTLTEKDAARGGKLLTKDDPLPQTMYRVDCKA